MGGVVVTTGANMNANSLPFFGGEVRKDAVVQVHKLLQQSLGGIQFDRQSPFGEVDLHAVGAVVKTAADVGNGLVNQIVQELLLGVTFDPICWIKQGNRRGGDDCLFEGFRSELLSPGKVGPCVFTVAERAFSQMGQLAGMAIFKQDHNAIRG